MKLKRITVGSFEVNCYIIISNSNRAIIIDPAAESKKIKEFLEQNKITPSFILHTHAHIDHIKGDKDFFLPIYIHRKDLPLLKDPLLNLSKWFTEPFTLESEIVIFDSDQSINLDEINLKVIHTPGHTPGSSCFLFLNHQSKILFSGDTLFRSGIGRTDFPGGCQAELIKSVKEKLFSLDDDTVVYPGHGPATNIGQEKEHFHFLK
ncbi:MAG: MBL fold metallo-hydrolase [Candidatus Omnitrophica bacterium]|nr:MBL fold metallo-hydrolase [Candidatus Omnitrophota bacterium]